MTQAQRMIEANPSGTLGRWRGAGDRLASFDDDISGLGLVRKRSKGLIAGALAGLAAGCWWGVA